MGPVLALVLVLGPVLAQVRNQVPVLWMVPDSLDYAALVPAVRLALEDLKDLKEQLGALGRYELQLHPLDSQCDVGRVLRSLFDLKWAGPEYLLLLGAHCPSVTSAITTALPALKLVQVSFVAPPNGKWSGHMISTVPSYRALNMAAVKLLQEFGWRKVGLLSEHIPQLIKSHRDLELRLEEAQIQVVSAQSFSDEACSALNKLKEDDVRIIIAQFEEDSASEVFCCAYRLNLFGPWVQWILVGASGGWKLGWSRSGCSSESLLMAAEGAVRVQVQPLRHSQEPGVSGQTAEEYEERYLRQLIHTGSQVSPLHGFAYDAVWVTALALSRVLEDEKRQKKYKINSTQASRPRSERVLQAVRNTRFTGVTGLVVFRNGERMSTIELIQFQGGSGVLVGEFNTTVQRLCLNLHLLSFRGGSPPRDRTEVRAVPRHVTLLLYVVMATISGLLLLQSLGILCFCVINRRLRLVRWRAVSQEELLCLGLVLVCSSVLVSGLDQVFLSDCTRTVLCSVQLWTVCVGHSVVFSVLFCDAWNLYSLHQRIHQSKLQKPGGVLLWTLLLDVFVLTSWQVLDPLRRVEGHYQQADPSDKDVWLKLVSHRCSSSRAELWVAAVCGYKGPLLGLALFVVYSLGPGLVGLSLKSSVSALSLFSLLGTLAYISHDAPLQFSLSSGFVLSGVLSVLAAVFGPKFFLLWAKGSDLKLSIEIEEEEEDMKMMKNCQLKMRSLYLDMEIKNITMELSETDQPGTFGGAGACGGVGRWGWTHQVQVCAEDTHIAESPGCDHINSPELVRRRASLQLPILHHSYLPLIGGVSPSSTDTSIH